MFKRSQLESVQAWIAHPANSALPLHTRIQRAIRQLIMDGALGRGAALPSTRALAKHLQVSRDTIETAYTQLHSEGFIERKVGSGSYVAESILSFIGAGLRPSTPSWGNIMAEGRGIWQIFPYPIFFSSIFLTATVLSINLIGDGLRDFFDPRQGD